MKGKVGIDRARTRAQSKTEIFENTDECDPRTGMRKGKGCLNSIIDGRTIYNGRVMPVDEATSMDKRKQSIQHA